MTAIAKSSRNIIRPSGIRQIGSPGSEAISTAIFLLYIDFSQSYFFWTDFLFHGLAISRVTPMRMPRAKLSIGLGLVVILNTGLPMRAETVDCLPLTFEARRIWSKRALEDALIHDIQAQQAKTGHINWDCLEREFQHLSPRASNVRHPAGGLDGADVYRFTLDRSNNFFAILRQWGPGASNGVFVAIFNHTHDGKVAVIRRGGKTEWLKSGSKEKQ